MDSIRPYKQVLQFLTEIIEHANYTPNYKLPSERMLAIKFKASRRSIRMAYDSLIAQGLVIKIHGKGHFTTGNKNKRGYDAHTHIKQIYFVVPEIGTEFPRNILNGITDFCDKHAMDVSIKISKGNFAKEERYISSAFLSDVKGLILFPIDNDSVSENLLKLSASRYPVTIIDRYFKNVNSSFVSTDHYSAMLNAVRFLKEKNHKHILYISPLVSLATSVEERINGYYEGLDKYYHSRENGDLLIMNTFNPAEVKKELTAYLKAHPKTDVIITTGLRSTTDAVIASVHGLKLSIPKDVKLMVFDNDFSTTELKLFRPYVISQDAYQIGYKSAAALYNQIFGDLRTENVRLPTTIIDFSKKHF